MNFLARTAAFVSLVALLSFTGCESVRHDISASVAEKFTGPVYSKRLVVAALPRTFEAVKSTLGQQGFRITRAGVAQGVVEGVSGLTSDDRLRGSRQLTVKVRLASTVDGGTEVAVLFTEVIEDDFNKRAGQGTESSLRTDPIYEMFFGRLNDLLAAP